MNTGINGVVRIDPQEAMAKANSMKNIANSIEDLLNKVDKKLAEVNDEETGMYHGAKKPSELKAELDEYKQHFVKFHEQINKYSDNIVTIAQQMLAE